MRIKKTVCILLIAAFTLTGDIANAIEETHSHGSEEEDLILNHVVKIQDGSVLNIIDCVAYAFQNSPKIRRQKYNLDVAKSNLGVARSAYFPVIGAGVGFNYQRNSDSIYYDKRYRDLPVVGVSVNKLVWDFGRTTANIKMEEFYKIGAEYEFMDSLCNTLFDIKAKYYSLLKAKALLNVAKNNMEINKNFVELAKKKNNKADLTTAQLNYSESKIKYIEAENTVNNARFDLSNAMYIESQPNYDIENTPTFTYNDDYAYGKPAYVETKPFEPYAYPFKTEDALDIAYKNSPDLQVLISTKNAMEQALKYIQRSYMPSLNAGVGYNYNNTNFTHNNGLSVGVNLQSSTNLMELKHSIKGAQAQLNLADNEIDLFKRDLYYEVRRAFNNVDRAKKQVPTAKTEVEQSLENLTTVENKYKSNELDYVALQDARKDYIRALDSYIESVYNYNIALIQVEMAMHYHLIDIHHKSEHAMHYHSAELIEHLNKALECNQKEVNKNNKKKRK
ncbi:MAG: TolC family protein [Cyanobacteriota bacterium]|nr:TolC family protein [Cyanobacteriota bacterium]